MLRREECADDEFDDDDPDRFDEDEEEEDDVRLFRPLFGAAAVAVDPEEVDEGAAAVESASNSTRLARRVITEGRGGGSPAPHRLL